MSNDSLPRDKSEVEGHTPGPWCLCDRGDYADFDGDSRVILGDGMRVAVVQTDGRPETEANAHLIAAAPDLLQACAELVNDLCCECGLDTPDWAARIATGDETDSDSMERARAAIALTTSPEAP